jgi:thioesterase domain-containing protein
MTRVVDLIDRLIDRAAARGPDRTAIVCGDERLSYRELIARSRALASYLVASGVGREQLMCVADIDPARLGAHIAVFGATATGFLRWQPARRYPGRIINFLARDGHPEFGHERYDWSSFVERPVETIEVPGNHFSLVNEPHVAALDRVLEGIP